MKIALAIVVFGIALLGAGCASSSDAFVVTSPDGSVISNGGMANGITAPAFAQQPTFESVNGSSALH